MTHRGRVLARRAGVIGQERRLPKLALNGPERVARCHLLLGAERTCRAGKLGTFWTVNGHRPSYEKLRVETA
jgi:hypothetical protein